MSTPDDHPQGHEATDDARTITTSAVVLRNEDGELLTVRKRGTRRFMLPGGKPDPGETPARTAVREVAEELGIELDVSNLSPLGVFSAPAANEPGATVVSHVFLHPVTPLALRADASAEIEELRWMRPEEGDRDDLAPLLAGRVLPALVAADRIDERPRPAVDARGADAAQPGTAPRRITVFAGASSGGDPALLALATSLGAALARADIELVYGGGGAGLMGAVADAAIGAGGTVLGVIPERLMDAELGHRGITSVEVVDSMHDRKLRMAELGDAFIALPGGIGTLEEFFEAWTWQQLGYHAKPVALLDTDYWRPLLDLVDHMVTQGFVAADFAEGLVLADTADEVLDALTARIAEGPAAAESAG